MMNSLLAAGFLAGASSVNVPPTQAFVGAVGGTGIVQSSAARLALRGAGRQLQAASLASLPLPVPTVADQGVGAAIAQWASAQPGGQAGAGAAYQFCSWWAAAIGGVGGVAATNSGARRSRQRRRKRGGASNALTDGVATIVNPDQSSDQAVNTNPGVVLVPVMPAGCMPVAAPHQTLSNFGDNGSLHDTSSVGTSRTREATPDQFDEVGFLNLEMASVAAESFKGGSHCSSPTNFSAEQGQLTSRLSFCSTAASEASAVVPTRWVAKDADLAIARLQGSDEGLRQFVMDQVSSTAWSMAMSKHGCRVLQAALIIAETRVRLTVSDAFRGRVWEAIRSPHANHVLQQCIVLLPPVHTQFVLEELADTAVDAARHQFGCRVLERLLEHDSWKTSRLIGEILNSALELAQHPYGNFVMQHVLEHGTDDERRTIGDSLLPEIRRLARHKNASHVVETLLRFSNDDDKQRLKKAMSSDVHARQSLSHSNYGSFVAKAMRQR